MIPPGYVAKTNRIHLHRVPVLALLCAGALCLMPALSDTASAAEARLRVLILSGQNNHDWRTTTPRIKEILLATDRFTVDVTEQPGQCDAASFNKYDVLVSNWNSFGAPPGQADWPAATREAFLGFVREGRGLVVVHAGGSSFPDWTEYHKLIGGTWGAGTGHGPIHAFDVKMAAVPHPITKGVEGFTTTDELWHRMAVQPEKQIIATAFSSADKGGSGQDEPVAMVMQYGRGRCFNLVLGHDVPAMASAGFQVLLARGTEWAATGRVTLLAKLPVDYEALVKGAAGYKFGQSRAALVELHRQVAAADTDPQARHLAAAALSKALSSDATIDAKEFFCEQLAMAGSAAEVPALAGLLTDPKLGSPARMALERIPGDDSAAALRAALARTEGPLRIGLIESLATRRDEKTVAILEKMIGQGGAPTDVAILHALGQIGTPACARALAKAKVGTELQSEWADAQLQCAEQLVRDGSSRPARQLAEPLLGTAYPAPVRSAAFGILLELDSKQKGVMIESSLCGKDPVLRQAALRAVSQSEDPAIRASAVKAFDSLDTESKSQLLTIMAEQGGPAAVTLVSKALKSSDPSLRRAGLSAAGTLHEADLLNDLLAISQTADPSEQTAIVEALSKLSGSKVDAAMQDALATAPDKTAVLLVRALVQRAGPGVPSILSGFLTKDNAALRREALRGLEQVGTVDQVAVLIALLPKATGDRSQVESALSGICRRTRSVEALAAPFAASAADTKISLLNVAASVGNAPALGMIRPQLSAPEPEVSTAAVRLLSDWPDPAPLGDLAGYARQSGDPKQSALAIRGVLRLVKQFGETLPADAPATLSTLLPAASSAQQKEIAAAFAYIPSLASLQASAALLEKPELANEAAASVLEIAEKVAASNPAEARGALEKVSGSSASDSLKEKATGLRAKLGAAAPAQ